MAIADDVDDDTVVSFTQKDLFNAERFARHNYLVRLLELMLKKRPHLTSYLIVTDRPATDLDYYIPPTLADKCRVLDVKIGPRLCAKLSCNRTTEHKPCTPDSEASYYWVGDDSYDVQCQPACFNVKPNKTYETDGSRSVDMPRLNYHKNSCRIVPEVITAYLEKPFYRSQTKYETRVNDMPTGFSRVPNDRDYGCGFDYRNNAAYCAYYDRTLDASGDCSYEWWETGLDAVVGMSFINTVKSSIRKLNSTEIHKRLPDNLPEKPTKPRTEHTLTGWRADVNSDFVLPPLVDVVDMNAEQRNRIKSEVLDSVETEAVRKKRSTNASYASDKPFLEKAHDTLQKLMMDLMKMLQSEEFWTSLGVSWVFDRSLDEVKRFSYKVIENVQKSLTRDLYKIVESAFSKSVLKGVMQSTARVVVTHTALRTFGKAAVMLAKTTAMSATVVGWLLIVVNVLDFIFALWDPYGYNNMFPKELPNDLMLNGEAALRNQFGVSVAEFTFESLVNSIVTDDEILQLQLIGIMEKSIYLDNLEVNSEGSFINKRDIILISDSDFNLIYDKESKKALAGRTRFDLKTYESYNRDFLRRVRINKILNTASLTLASLSSLGCTRRKQCYKNIGIRKLVISVDL
ncbi:uncharacterized protein LOC113558287 [Rhopalosiphum maidis]|uniref:uncharacterized protein LOC113558287 n=1 Tax=Rhopalosiphum maidis TaxID=43146 RepID=UPI000EFDF343|nr:uncharacterized protein LOC113558287 [Rhopalosiphum maidis]